MNRLTTSSSDEATFTPALTRPTSAARRFRGRLQRLRLAWRRAALAVGAGLLAALMTVAWMTASSSPIETAEPTPGPSSLRPPGTAPSTLAENERVLALDRSTIALPVSVGSVVEVIGLRPTLDHVRAEVIAARAQVVGVTEDAILIAVEADAAHTAAEIAAVGRVTILGRDAPPDWRGTSSSRRG